ncbi:MAG: guanylate kinase [Anaerolineaceae bacterium]|nr:guanylate kinase [Anaerolineaceae bacterium]
MEDLSDNQGLLFIVVGPPGVGKNALMENAMQRQPRLQQLATATTRPRRPTEQEGRERLFVSISRFQQMIEQGDLLEWQEVHPGKFYGVPRKTVEDALANGKFLIADIDVLGATYIRSLYPENVILIFVQPPSIETLEDRMHERGETEADIQTRLSRVAMEMAYLPGADYIVTNDDFEQAAQQFNAVIAQEITRHRNHRQYSHTVTVIPIFENEYLRHENEHPYPTTALHPQEIPHIAALRILQETLHTQTSVDNLMRSKPNTGSFILPAAVSVVDEGSTKHITFTYVYLLTERVLAADGWHWHPLETLEHKGISDLALQNRENLAANS